MMYGRFFVIHRGPQECPGREPICVFEGTVDEVDELCRRMNADDPEATVPDRQYYWRAICAATLDDYHRFLRPSQ